MLFTNIDDVNWQILSIVKLGYGTYKEISELDTPEFLDMVEFININNDIERHYLDYGGS